MTKKTTSPKPRTDNPNPAAPAEPKQIIGRFVDTAGNNGRGEAVAVFCHETPGSFIGAHVEQIVRHLASRGRHVHLFCREAFDLGAAGVKVHAVGAGEEGDVVAQAKDFVRRAGNAFMQAVPAGQATSVIAFEWSAAGVIPLLRGLRNQHGVLSLHSLERQRSDLSSETSKQIEVVEREALEAAQRVLLHEQATAEQVRLWLPDCAERIVTARERFAVEKFESNLDPGEVKARYQIGPIDPVLLYVGDLDERYGPDLLMKAMPALLRHHSQARLVIVGDGQLQWPLRVYARYLLLEYAVRIVGSVVDQPLRELVAASDVVCVPSRESTPWWPILAGWAARRPVVATHDAAKGLTDHEKDSVLIYPSENSVVWGVERVLYDADLRKAIGDAGRKKVEARFGWSGLVEQVEELLVPASAGR
jgi:glycosyltransferase involved in cell wall biosynthesis